ncbi:MAG: DUF2807 domain-containing protein [Devosia sp.]
MNTSLVIGIAAGAVILTAALAVMTPVKALAGARTFELAPFSRATVTSGLTAKFAVGATQSVAVDSVDARDMEDLRLQVIDGHLHAWVARDFWDYVTFNLHDIAIAVTVPALEQLGASSGAQVEAAGLRGNVAFEVSSGASLKVAGIDAGASRISASSGGSIWLDGSCVTETVQISSEASIAGNGFECVDLEIEASSGSSSTFFTTGYVNATASSGAIVNRLGGPDHVDDETSSGGDVKIIN